MLEEEIFYPTCRDAFSDSDDLDEAQVEHDGARLLVRRFPRALRGFAARLGKPPLSCGNVTRRRPVPAGTGLFFGLRYGTR
jgi:hypothetical protein